MPMNLKEAHEIAEELREMQRRCNPLLGLEPGRKAVIILDDKVTELAAELQHILDLDIADRLDQFNADRIKVAIKDISLDKNPKGAIP